MMKRPISFHVPLFLVAGLLAGCSQVLQTGYNHTTPAGQYGAATVALPASQLAERSLQSRMQYPCPDLFEGHIFSCPTVPTVGVGIDVNTDAIVGGVELGCPQGHGGVCVVPGIEYGRGSQDFGDVDPMTGEPLSYTVLQVKAHGRLSVPVTDNANISFSPLAGPRYYRFSYSDCPFMDGCTENIFMFDVGAGLQFRNFGLDVYSALNGPNVAFRLKYMLGAL